MARQDPEVTLGSEIARLRTKTGFTLRKFAERVGISPAHQSDIEHDRRRPSRDLLQKIAKELAPAGATYEALARLDTRMDPEVQKMVSEMPEARAMLRAVVERARSTSDPRRLLKDLEKRAQAYKDKDENPA
jgi:transcriptional regulator with XRE-family HTH domain